MERGLGGRLLEQGQLQDSFLFQQSLHPLPTLSASVPALVTDPLHSSPPDRLCVLLSPGVFPGHFPWLCNLIKSRCSRMSDRRVKWHWRRKALLYAGPSIHFLPGPSLPKPCAAGPALGHAGKHRNALSGQWEGRGPSPELLILNCLLCKHPWLLFTCYSSVGVGS